MIITSKKELSEILDASKSYESLFLVGCGDCATLCRTGGEKELADMRETFTARGKRVTGEAVVPATCHELDTQRVLRKHKDEVASADAVLVFACGAGTQAVGDGIDKPALSGVDSLFIGNSKRQMHFYEKCSACGECVLNHTAGLCPETRCPKTLLNAPCGGAVKGNCEVNPEDKCVWIEIYERLKSWGREDELLEIQPAKSHLEHSKPQRLEQKTRPIK